MIKFIVLWIISSAICFASAYQNYFKDTYQCLEAMRNKTTGLLRDSVTADLKTLHDPTSPSNIALDLLVQVESNHFQDFAGLGKSNINNILETLKGLPFHIESGLFYNRYSSDGKTVKEWYLSAVDNIHLAYALWVISKVHDEKAKRLTAESLFKRFHFNFLYDSETGLFHGGAYLKNGQWMVEKWSYDYWGSEGRSLYGLSYALGLNKDPRFIEKFKLSMMIEVKDGSLMLWDGGAFQLLLPDLLISETHYSPSLKAYFLKYAKEAIELGAKRKYPVPANHSAGQVSLTEYNGKAGSKELVSSMNADFKDPILFMKWDNVFTPHAAFLAATVNANAYENFLQTAEGLGKNKKLYLEGLGWLDGFHLRGEEQGEVVPVFLALDQAIIALATAKILSKDGQLTGAKLLNENWPENYLLQKFYQNTIK
ncbi:MAG TPA: hypothetical protein VNJ01_13840 [Bacteriovoracaceae bacterium]|nr:hypothetical protein [Bacteriovoracaceae bacterium]